MSSARTYVRSLMANWIGHGANMVVMLFLSPFVVHSLGTTAYGVWSLLMTVTGYLGLAEIGVRVSTGRYINYHMARGEQGEVDRVVSTSLVFYTFISALVLAVAAGLGWSFGELFPKVPRQLAVSAVWVLLLTALNVWLGFMASVFGQLLRAKNRFDLRGIVTLTELAVRAGGTVVVLKLGGRLVALAGVLAASSATSFVLFTLLSRWKGAPARFGLRSASWRKFRELISYGSWALVRNVSIRLIGYTDAVVIALLLGMDEVALYSIAMVLADAAGQFVAHVFRVVEPDTMKAGGQHDLALIRWYIIRGTRACLFLAVPVYVGLMTLGHRFIRLWMGTGFAASGWVLAILTVAQLAGTLRWASLIGLDALGFVRLTAVMVVLEAALNLLLSVLFVVAFGWGIYGVAAGTTVPCVFLGMVLTVICVRSRIRLPVRTFLSELVCPAAVAGGLFAVPCLAAGRLVKIDSWASFSLTVAALAAAYLPIGLFVFMRGPERSGMYQRMQLLIGRLARRPLGVQ